MPHFLPSGVTHGVTFHCCYMGCGVKHETEMPVDVWTFPVQLNPITVIQAPAGWEVRGRMAICPNHRPPGATVQ